MHPISKYFLSAILPVMFRTVLLLIYFVRSLNGKYFIIETEDKLEQGQRSGNHIADDYQDVTTTTTTMRWIEKELTRGYCANCCDCEMVKKLTRLKRLKNKSYRF